MQLTPAQAFFDSLKPCIESQRLAEWSNAAPGETIVDLGCGAGYLALRLAHRVPAAKWIVGIEIQPSLAIEARENLLNTTSIPLTLCPLEIVAADARYLPFAAPFADRIVCNPPFFEKTRSRPSPVKTRQTARGDATMSLHDAASCAESTMKENGELEWVLPAARRDDALHAAEGHGFTLIAEEREASIRQRSGGVVFMRLRLTTPA